MELIADGLLIAGAMTAALYCWVLSRRLNAFKSMDKGLGGAIAGLSARVEQTRSSLSDTKATARDLAALPARAEAADSAPGGPDPQARPEPPRAAPDAAADRPDPRSEPVAAAVADPVPRRPAEKIPASRENDLVSALRRIAAGTGR